ncbi:retention module-containing protein [Chromobacterium sp. CV08]|uniref:retention module-containing protein n=1 Tax=Chromobacterium sp. CV08 TaxID=3133274 RepID=UPI003DA80890
MSLWTMPHYSAGVGKLPLRSLTMATSTEGHILTLQGSVKAIGIDGKARLLRVGDILLPGEQLQLENGAAIDISRTDGQMLHVDGTRRVTLTEDVLRAQHADVTEASIAPLTPEAQQILAALDNPNPGPNANPFDNLDPAAAGLNDPGGENSGHSFIRIGRISESLTGLQLEAAPTATAGVPTAQAAANETPDSPPFFTAANGAPLGSDLNVTTKEDTPVSGTLTASDPDGDPLTFVKGSDPAHGVVVVNPNGSWTYTPGQDYNGSDKFTVTVNDGRGGTATVTVNVGVTPVGDPAAIGGTDHGVVVEDDITQVSGTLVVKDPDPGEAGFQPQADIKVDYGTFHFDSATGQWTFTLDNAKAQALTNADRFDRTFTIQSLDGTTHTVTVTIQGKDDPAIITGGNGNVTEDQNVSTSNTLDYRDKLNIVDPDQGQAVFNTARVDSQAGNLGTLTINADGSWHYSVDNAKVQYLGQGDTRTETFTVYSQDGTAHNVIVVINGVNDPADIGHGAGDVGNGTVKEDTPAQTVASGKLTVVDIDQGQAQLQPSQQVTDYGTFQANADGTWTFTINNGSAKVQALGEGDTVPLQFTVTSKDGSATSVVTIHVLGTNDAAVIGGTDRGTVIEDKILQIGDTLIVKDVDQGQSYFQAQTNTAGTYGTFSIDASGNWKYNLNNSDPAVQALNQGESRIESFIVKSADGTTSTVTVTILGTNDAAVITPHTQNDGHGEVKEDTVLTTQGKLDITDVDTGQAFFQTQTDTAGTYGTFSIDANGNWHYNLNNSAPIVQALGEGESHIETFIVKSVDGTTSTVTVTVVGTNDVAVIDTGAGTVKEDTTLTAQGTLHITDPDAGQAHFQTQTDTTGTYGTFSIDANGNWHYNLNNSDPIVQALGEGESHIETFVVKSVDGTTSTVTVTVVGTNDVAVIDTGAGTVKEDTTVTAQGTLHITDPDAGQAFFQTQTDIAGTYGKFSIDANGNWHYNLNNSDPIVQALNEGESHIETFVVKSIDGTTSTVTVTVVGTNDVAVIDTGAGTVKEDTTVTAQGTLHITDPDAGQSFFQTQTNTAGTYGTFSIDANGNWHYNLNNSDPIVQALSEGESHLETFVVKSIDGTTSTVTVTVVGTNDLSVIGGKDTGDVTEDQKLNPTDTTPPINQVCSGTLTITDVDQHDHPAFDPTHVVSQAGNLGSLTIDASGNWNYSVVNNLPGVQELGQGATRYDTFTVYGIDGSTHDITVTIHGVNDAAEITGVTAQATNTKANSIGNTLTITDVDKGEAVFASDIHQVETYGTFDFNKNTGDWTFTLNDNAHNYTGQKNIIYEYTVMSKDGTASESLTITIKGVTQLATNSYASQDVVAESQPTRSELLSAKLDAATPDKTATSHHADAVSRETNNAAATAGHAKAGAGEVAAAESHPHGAASHEPNIVYGAQKAAVEPAGDKPSSPIAHDTPHIADSRASHAAPDSHHPAAAEAGTRGGTGIDTFKWTLGEPNAAAKPEPARNEVADHSQRGDKSALDLKDLLPEGGHRAASLDSYLNAHKEGADAAADTRHSSPGAPAAQALASADLTHAIALSDAQVLKNLLNHGQQHTE